MERWFAVPGARDGGAAKDVDESRSGAREDNVGGREVAEDSEGGVWGEAEVEAEHGGLGENVGHVADHDCGEANLRV